MQARVHLGCVRAGAHPRSDPRDAHPTTGTHVTTLSPLASSGRSSVVGRRSSRRRCRFVRIPYFDGRGHRFGGGDAPRVGPRVVPGAAQGCAVGGVLVTGSEDPGAMAASEEGEHMRRLQRPDPTGTGVDHGSAPAAGRGAITRRQAIGKVSKGAAMVGVAAWITPEILMATPSAAGALSPPPGGGGGTGVGVGVGVGVGASGSADAGGGGSSVGAGGAASGSANLSGSTSPPLAHTAAGSTSGVTLDSSISRGPISGGALPAADRTATVPFSGFDAVRDVEIGTAAVVGGWLLTRWAGAKPGAVLDGPAAGPAGPHPPAPGSAGPHPAP